MNKYLESLIKKAEYPVIFDYDGVLFEARWYEDRINMSNETEERLIEAMKLGNNLYTNPIPMMKPVIQAIKADIYVLSHMHNNLEYMAKCDQIEKYYPKIPKDHILVATSPEDKIRYMEDIRDQYGGFIYIDDNHPHLMTYENYFDGGECEGNFCKFFHVSSLYVNMFSQQEPTSYNKYDEIIWD